MTKRDLFGEIMEGVEAMREHREGKLTLRTYKRETVPPPPVDADYIRETREALHMSSQVFARSLRLNPRTVERWEQGETPNPAARVLISLVNEFPDTLQCIAQLSADGDGPTKKEKRAAASGRRPTKKAGKKKAASGRGKRTAAG